MRTGSGSAAILDVVVVVRAAILDLGGSGFMVQCACAPEPEVGPDVVEPPSWIEKCWLLIGRLLLVVDRKWWERETENEAVRHFGWPKNVPLL